jgi:YidC/Oxa1 family membrane protein insertase
MQDAYLSQGKAEEVGLQTDPSGNDYKMMEKKTLLAFGLSFLILIAWSLLFSPTAKRPDQAQTGPAQEKPIASTVPEPTDKSPAPNASPGGGAAAVSPPANIEEKEVTVETDLYRAVLSNAGPTIKSLELKQYRQTIDPHSPPIDIVGTKEDIGNFLLLGFTPESGDRDSLKATVYEMDRQQSHVEVKSDPQEVVFRGHSSDGLSLTQTFRFYPDSYRIDVRVEVQNPMEMPVNGSFRAELSALPPSKKGGYYSYVGLIALDNDKLEEMELKEGGEDKTLTGEIQWMAYEDDYFISAVVPQQGVKGRLRGSRSQTGLLKANYAGEPGSLSPSGSLSTVMTLYFGPRDLGVLRSFGHKLDRAVYFGWTDIIAKPLLYVLRFFYQYLHNYGFSIILLTILVKIIFWPLTHKSYKSMKEMQKLQPRIAKIREKYKGNREQLNREMMGLYKTYKINPMSGCLPMVIQIPVFFALFRILGSAIELRHAPFMLWIKDLSAPDRLFSFPFSIPFMSPPYGIPVLTLLMGASMFIQQKMTPTPGDPAQAKIMMLLPVVFTVMFINFQSGLVLYWLVNNLLSIGQQYRIQKTSV